MEPDQLLFAKTHEWTRIEEVDGSQVATVGLSAFAVELLTDLVFMELPERGRTVKAGESVGEIESVRLSDLSSFGFPEGVTVSKGNPLFPRKE